MEEAWTAIVFRLVVAFAASSLIALERQLARKAVPFGTYVLVCTGSCLFVLVQIQTRYAGIDLGLTSGLIAGVGFLGTGALTSRGGRAHGFTTATSIWLMAAIGASIGAAMYQTAGAAFGMIVMVLVFDGWLERHGIGGYVRDLKVVVADPARVPEVTAALAPYRGQLAQLSWDADRAELTLSYRVSLPAARLVESLAAVRGIAGLRGAGFE